MRIMRAKHFYPVIGQDLAMPRFFFDKARISAHFVI